MPLPIWVVLGVSREAWKMLPASEKQAIKDKAAKGLMGLATISFNRALKKAKAAKIAKQQKAKAKAVQKTKRRAR